MGVRPSSEFTVTLAVVSACVPLDLGLSGRSVPLPAGSNGLFTLIWGVFYTAYPVYPCVSSVYPACILWDTCILFVSCFQVAGLCNLVYPNVSSGYTKDTYGILIYFCPKALECIPFVTFWVTLGPGTRLFELLYKKI